MFNSNMSVEGTASVANAPMKMVLDGINSAARAVGYDLPSYLESGLQTFFGSGCFGAVPAAALWDDVQQLHGVLEQPNSLGRSIGACSISTEIAADIGELLEPAGELIHSMTGFDGIETWAKAINPALMFFKSLGGAPLAVSSIDQAYAQIAGREGFLGSKPEDNQSIHHKISLSLRALETASAAISTGILATQGIGPAYARSSMIATGAKVARILVPQMLVYISPKKPGPITTIQGQLVQDQLKIIFSQKRVLDEIKKQEDDLEFFDAIEGLDLSRSSSLTTNESRESSLKD